MGTRRRGCGRGGRGVGYDGAVLVVVVVADCCVAQRCWVGDDDSGLVGAFEIYVRCFCIFTILYCLFRPPMC